MFLFGFSFDISVPLLSLLSEYLRFLVKWPLDGHFVSLYEVQSANAASVPAHCEEIIPNLLADPIALMIKYSLMAPLRMDIGKIYTRNYCLSIVCIGSKN